MLSTSEQIDHLKLSAEHAGLELPAVELPESHHLVVGRMRLHYLDWGTKGRHPILFLHGGGKALGVHGDAAHFNDHG